MPEIDTLHGDSRVWIYQADRELSEAEMDKIQPLIDRFVQSWVSHNKALKGFGKFYHRRFLVFMVDETYAGASGCSIDQSVRFIEELGQMLEIDFFNRMNFAFLSDNEVRTIRMDEMAEAVESQQINENTMMFDNLVKSKDEFTRSWLKPLKSSWHSQFI